MEIRLTLAIILFAVTYILLMVFTKYRAYIAVGSAILFLAAGILPVSAVPSRIDWNVIMMLVGSMGIVSLFIASKMPARLADILIDRVPNVKWAVIALSVFAGVISAFVDNVATVLMVAPVALMIAKKLEIRPAPIIIAIAISSNLQGAATLVGDTTSILLGGYANMDFLDFFWFLGRPGLFWITELGALAATLILAFLFRKEKQPISSGERTEVTDYFPTVLLVGLVLLLIAASFIPGKPPVTNGLICVALMVIGLVRELLRGNAAAVKNAFKEIDFTTLFMLAGLFIVIGGITEAGVIDAISRVLVSLCGDSLFLSYTVIVWFSVLISAFIDNIPYVATMLPVVTGMASLMGIEPYILYYGLLVGATLGGNITPIGASANITAIGILEKEGVEVKPAEFMKMGVPFTLAAVITGYVLIWIIF